MLPFFPAACFNFERSILWREQKNLKNGFPSKNWFLANDCPIEKQSYPKESQFCPKKSVNLVWKKLNSTRANSPKRKSFLFLKNWKQPCPKESQLCPKKNPTAQKRVNHAQKRVCSAQIRINHPQNSVNVPKGESTLPKRFSTVPKRESALPKRESILPKIENGVNTAQKRVTPVTRVQLCPKRMSTLPKEELPPKKDHAKKSRPSWNKSHSCPKSVDPSP